MNNSRQIVGWIGQGYGLHHAVLRDDGNPIDLPSLPGDDVSRAVAINDAGQIVRQSGTYAVAWQDGEILRLDSLEGEWMSFAHAINDAGQIVGWSATTATPHQSTVWENSSVAALPGLSDHPATTAQGINNAGQIVGFSDGPGGSRALLWEDSRLIDLNVFPQAAERITVRRRPRAPDDPHPVRRPAPAGDLSVEFGE
jgi:probable HAF family extracellular repeat protein